MCLFVCRRLPYYVCYCCMRFTFDVRLWCVKSCVVCVCAFVCAVLCDVVVACAWLVSLLFGVLGPFCCVYALVLC